MFFPSLEEVRTLAKSQALVPIYSEQYADTETPISVFMKLRTRSEPMILLESVHGTGDNMRYSFIGRHPFLTVTSYGRQIHIKKEGVGEESVEGHPLELLEELCQQYRAPLLPDFSGFSGGAVGYFGYDTVRLQENLPNPPEDTLGLPDLQFLFMDEIIAFDHRRQKLMIFVNMRTDGNLAQSYERACRRIIEIQNELSSASLPKPEKRFAYRKSAQLSSNLSKEEFCDMVKKAKGHIVDGDIFQVVLAQRFSMETDVDPLQVYRALRVINPSPYMYFLDFGDSQLVGASPERLLRVENGMAETCPIAGARKRGATEEEDEALIADLLADPKEVAEHTMLVDLGRNDIGRVAEYGTVRTKRFKYVEKYSHVIHILSDVEGKLREDCSAFDALASVLPAGTLSGAPKVRAMEIIDELETVKRGAYGGGIAYLGFNGSFDSCITIRTAVFKEGNAYIGAGAGIVFDSVPENEYQESRNKAMAMIRAIEEAEEMA